LTSIPKAGTYLFGEFIKNLGFVDAGIHIEGRGGASFTDYRFIPLHEARQNPHLPTQSSPLAETLELILPGQYVVSHLQITDDLPAAALSGFKLVFAYRNLRDCLVSLLLFLERTAGGAAALAPLARIVDKPGKTLYLLGRHGRHWLDEVALIMNIQNRGDVLRLKFEDATNADDARVRTRLAHQVTAFLGIDLDAMASARILLQTLEAQTLTKSAGRTSIDAYWNAEVEREFARLGGCDLNRQLGYD
jgi:hypothetical protein